MSCVFVDGNRRQGNNDSRLGIEILSGETGELSRLKQLARKEMFLLTCVPQHDYDDKQSSERKKAAAETVVIQVDTRAVKREELPWLASRCRCSSTTVTPLHRIEPTI
jgi:hypothetical protein